MPMFSNLREDWQTYDGSLLRQGLWVMLVYRFGKWSEGLGSRVLRAPFSLAYRLLRTLCQVLTGVDLPCEAKVGRRLLIEHCGSIVISAETQIGDDCVIRQGVACGPRQRGLRGAPRIGNGVEIGAGAKLLGPIEVGDGAMIGANAVVLSDVLPGALAVGVPATMKLRRPPEELVDEHVPEESEIVREPASPAEIEADEGVLIG